MKNLSKLCIELLVSASCWLGIRRSWVRSSCSCSSCCTCCSYCSSCSCCTCCSCSSCSCSSCCRDSLARCSQSQCTGYTRHQHQPQHQQISCRRTGTGIPVPAGSCCSSSVRTSWGSCNRACCSSCSSCCSSCCCSSCSTSCSSCFPSCSSYFPSCFHSRAHRRHQHQPQQQ